MYLKVICNVIHFTHFTLFWKISDLILYFSLFPGKFQTLVDELPRRYFSTELGKRIVHYLTIQT